MNPWVLSVQSGDCAGEETDLPFSANNKLISYYSASETLAVHRRSQETMDVNGSKAHATTDPGEKGAQKRRPREATRAGSQVAAGGEDKEA